MISNRKKTKYAILIFCSLLVFIKLGKSEIQGWDEGVYAMRALSILEFGAFWDQTEYSPAGLYSSSYPPFVIWMMAASISIFGKSAFAVRLFSALCSVLALFLTYKISKKIISAKNSILPSVLIAGALLWNNGSRRAELDVPVITLGILSFYLMLKIFEQNNEKKMLIYCVFLFFSFTACLMSKVITPFFPMLLLVPVLVLSKNNKARFSASVTVVLSIIVASVWFIYMWLDYNYEFITYISMPHFFINWNNAIRDTGNLFYFNQLLISNPFAIFSFIILILLIFRLKKFWNILIAQNGSEILIAFLLWFIISLAGFSLGSTKYLHYTVYILFPLVLLSIWFVDNIDLFIKNSKIKTVLIAFLLISFVWGLSVNLRNDIKAVITNSELTVISTIFIISTLALLSLSFAFSYKITDKIIISSYRKIIIAISILLILKIAFINYTQPSGYQQGALLPVEILKHFGSPSYVYLYHEVNPTDSLNAQLSWYTDGWNLGWNKGKYHIPIALSENKSPYEAISRLDEYPDILIIYYFPEFNDNVKFISEEIQKTRRLLCRTKCYIVFGVKRSIVEGKMLANGDLDFQKENTSRNISCHFAIENSL